MGAVAAAIGGAGVLSAGASIIGSQSAASAQESAANNASQVQQNMFNTTQANLQPYMTGGVLANNALLAGLGLTSPTSSGNVAAATPSSAVSAPVATPATSGTLSPATYSGQLNLAGTGPYGYESWAQYNQLHPSSAATSTPTSTSTTATSGSSASSGGNSLSNILNSPLLQAPTQNLSQAALSQTPGYQYALMQGLESTQNAAAARGLGQSGAALKAAGTYATGQAENTYQQQYENAVTNQTNQFNRLNTVASSGQNAAAGLGGIGQQTASNIGNNLVGAGNAAGASIIAGTNGVNNAINSSLEYNYLNNALAADEADNVA